MRGVLDVAGRARVQGWAIRDKASAVVEVWINDERAGTAGATRMRPDVAAAFGCEPLCGFDFFLPRPLRPGDSVSVRFPEGQHLANSPSTPLEIAAFDAGILPTVPVCEHWGTSRGTPVDRHYIEEFLRRHAFDIRGHVLEIADRNYTRMFGAGRVTRSEVLDIDADNPDATCIADLTDGSNVPGDSFDCIILTQVLCLIMDARRAVLTLSRILKPGGVVLITVPGMSPVSSVPLEARNWNWSFYPNSLRWLLSDCGFDDRKLVVEGYGNLKTAMAFMMGLAREDLTEADFAVKDERFPLVVGARAVKPPCREPAA